MLKKLETWLSLIFVHGNSLCWSDFVFYLCICVCMRRWEKMREFGFKKKKEKNGSKKEGNNKWAFIAQFAFTFSFKFDDHDKTIFLDVIFPLAWYICGGELKILTFQSGKVSHGSNKELRCVVCYLCMYMSMWVVETLAEKSKGCSCFF